MANKYMMRAAKAAEKAAMRLLSAGVVELESLILRSDPDSPLAPGRPTNGGGTTDRVSYLTFFLLTLCTRRRAVALF